jgi:prepilin-type processing-associated H-X9-DG protein
MYGRTRLLLYALTFITLSSLVFADGPVPEPSSGALRDLSPKEVMDLANAWGMKSEENRITVWTSGRAFNFAFADGSKAVISMPDDQKVISIAPYIMKTHPCGGHYPSSCRGELSNIPVHVTAVATDGRKVLDLKTMTLPNGFVDLWLPRDLEVDVTIEARGLTATGRIVTFDKDATCITTLRLHY